jgi:hypothetical protein
MKFTSKKILTVLIALLTALIEHDEDLVDDEKNPIPELKLPEDKTI